MDRAVKIAEETLDIIAAVNDGIRPELEKVDTYFIASDEDTKYNLIFRYGLFNKHFKFVDRELEHQFAEVIEL